MRYSLPGAAVPAQRGKLKRSSKTALGKTCPEGDHAKNDVIFQVIFLIIYLGLYFFGGGGKTFLSVQ